MKIKILYLTVLIVFCIILTGCMFRSKTKVEHFSEEMVSEQEMSDKIMEDIANALDDGDVEALKELYAESAIKKSPELDSQIKDLIDYYKGEMVSYKGLASSHTSYRSGSKTMEFDGLYEVVTTEETYQILYIHKPVDDINEDEIGLYKIEIVTQEDYDKEVDVDGYYHWKYNDEETGAYYSYSDID